MQRGRDRPANPNSGDTGGVHGDDWRTWDNDELLLLQRLMR
jgi:hypothetical protein